MELVAGGKGERVAVASGEKFGIWPRVAVTDWTDGVDDVFCRQIAGSCDCRLASRQALRKTGCAELAAFFKYARTAATMDGPVDAASAEESAVSGVHDDVDVLRRDVADEDAEAIIEETCERVCGVHGERLRSRNAK